MKPIHAALIALSLLCCSVLAVKIYDDFDFPPALPFEPANNVTQHIIPLLDIRDLLDPRQGTEPTTAQACWDVGYGWCSNIPKCCPPSPWACCYGSCRDPTWGDCCGQGQCSPSNPQCCDNKGCIGYQDECCLGDTWCPAPFKCYEYVRTGQDICCTDSSCLVYLSGSVTMTRSATSAAVTAPAATTTTTRAIATTSSRAATTSRAITSNYVADDTTLRYYDTTIYWSYWYYFYTVYSIVSTTTSRVLTTVTSTTTFSCSATDIYEARSTFSLSSSELPTPSNAGVTIPITPTAGAVLIGSCTSSISGSTVTSSCGTERASATASTRSSISAGSTGSSSSSSGELSAAASNSLKMPVLPCLLALLCAALMIVL